jgi:YgiT-type zinc finger domain-containing protein
LGGFGEEKAMKCVICRSSDIEERVVDEMFWVDQDVILVPYSVLVCSNCGERYYSRTAMHRLEEIEENLRDKRERLETIGQVLKFAPQSEPSHAVRELSSEYDAESSESKNHKSG